MTLFRYKSPDRKPADELVSTMLTAAALSALSGLGCYLAGFAAANRQHRNTHDR